MGTLRKEHLVRQIAKDLYLREDVVEEVLDRFVDIAVEEIVNKGELKLHRLFSVNTVAYRGYSGGKGEVPAHNRLRIRLSDGIHRLFKMQQREGTNVNKDNWRSLLSVPAGSQVTRKSPLDKNESPELFNPLLDEE